VAISHCTHIHTHIDNHCQFARSIANNQNSRNTKYLAIHPSIHLYTHRLLTSIRQAPQSIHTRYRMPSLYSQMSEGGELIEDPRRQARQLVALKIPGGAQARRQCRKPPTRPPHINLHTYIHTYIQTHSHTHTHTHTQSLSIRTVNRKQSKQS
jgi:tryptophanyl-tRNA synthetase